jgi:hypothetical protein
MSHVSSPLARYECSETRYKWSKHDDEGSARRQKKGGVTGTGALSKVQSISPLFGMGPFFSQKCQLFTQELSHEYHPLDEVSAPDYPANLVDSDPYTTLSFCF